MALEGIALETAIKGFVGVGVKVFGQFLKDDPLKPAKQQIYNWSERYVKNYLRRHGQIQILGMSQAISLDEIYTNVRMLDAETVKSLESVEGLEQLYREANQRVFGKKELAKQKGIAVANTEQYLCVLGSPGIGKTTYLRKVGLEALQRNVGSYNHEKIPVFIELKQFRDPDLDIKKSIAEEFENCGFPNPEQFTEHALKSGDLLILLDGLDEVPSDNVNKVVQAIKNFSNRYSENRFITSCRIAAYHTYFTGFRTVAIAEFDDDQILDFIKFWFQADPNPQLTQEEKAEYANTIWSQLKTSDSIGTKELSQTPLLLTFVCLVFRQRKTITNNRAKLYSKALDILLEEWAKSKLLEENWEIYQDLSAELEKDMLASIAYVGFEEDKLFFEKDELAEQITAFLTDNLNAPKHIDANKVIDAISVQQGIFVERATDIYSFSHLTLQEYLCAEYIKEWHCQNKLVKRHATSDRWREIFFLVTGLMGRAAIELLEKLELQTKELSKYPKLNRLLAWVEDKTTSCASDYSGEINRVFTLILIFDLARFHDLVRARVRANVKARFRDIYLASDIRRARDLFKAIDLFNVDVKARKSLNTNDLVPIKAEIRVKNLLSSNDLTLAFARFSASALASDLTSALTSARSRARAYTFDRFSTFHFDRLSASHFIRANTSANASTKFALDKQLITDVELQPLISHLENLLILYLENSLYVSTSSAEELTSIISSSLDISSEFFELSEDDVQAFTNYLSTCQLMIDCSKQASGLSAQKWEAIKQQMFLPPQSRSSELMSDA